MKRKKPALPETLRRLFVGYEYVNQLLAAEIDLFAYGQSQHLLELNHRVLCGASPDTHAEAALHIAETVQHFYADRPGNIGEFSEWYQRNAKSPCEILAVKVFLQIVSSPQLFIEGNQRTAVLVASYIRARDGRSPVVITGKSFSQAIKLFDAAKSVNRRELLSAIARFRLQRQLLRFCRDNLGSPGAYLVPAHHSGEPVHQRLAANEAGGERW